VLFPLPLQPLQSPPQLINIRANAIKISLDLAFKINIRITEFFALVNKNLIVSRFLSSGAIVAQFTLLVIISAFGSS
jgi:hypothetical protein